MPCPFNRVAVVGSPLEPMYCLATGSWLRNSARFGFHLMEWGLSPMRR